MRAGRWWSLPWWWWAVLWAPWVAASAALARVYWQPAVLVPALSDSVLEGAAWGGLAVLAFAAVRTHWRRDEELPGSEWRALRPFAPLALVVWLPVVLAFMLGAGLTGWMPGWPTAVLNAAGFAGGLVLLGAAAAAWTLRAKHWGWACFQALFLMVLGVGSMALATELRPSMRLREMAFTVLRMMIEWQGTLAVVAARVVYAPASAYASQLAVLAVLSGLAWRMRRWQLLVTGGTVAAMVVGAWSEVCWHARRRTVPAEVWPPLALASTAELERLRPHGASVAGGKLTLAFDSRPDVVAAMEPVFSTLQVSKPEGGGRLFPREVTSDTSEATGSLPWQWEFHGRFEQWLAESPRPAALVVQGVGMFQSWQDLASVPPVAGARARGSGWRVEVTSAELLATGPSWSVEIEVALNSWNPDRPFFLATNWIESQGTFHRLLPAAEALPPGWAVVATPPVVHTDPVQARLFARVVTRVTLPLVKTHPTASDAALAEWARTAPWRVQLLRQARLPFRWEVPLSPPSE